MSRLIFLPWSLGDTILFVFGDLRGLVIELRCQAGICTMSIWNLWASPQGWEMLRDTLIHQRHLNTVSNKISLNFHGLLFWSWHGHICGCTPPIELMASILRISLMSMGHIRGALRSVVAPGHGWNSKSVPWAQLRELRPIFLGDAASAEGKGYST